MWGYSKVNADRYSCFARLLKLVNNILFRGLDMYILYNLLSEKNYSCIESLLKLDDDFVGGDQLGGSIVARLLRVTFFSNICFLFLS